MHLVGAPALPVGHCLRHDLAGRCAEAAEVNTLPLAVRPDELGQQPNANNRVIYNVGRQQFRVPEVGLHDARVKKRLQINQYRMLARRDQILEMKIYRFEHIKERQIAALPLVEAGRVPAGCRNPWR